jgi:formylglycine-generating enzyme required for sulfatase activity
MSVQVNDDVQQSRNRADRWVFKSASPSVLFGKVLRAFEIGDLSSTDLQSSLARLLKDGAPAEELLRVLRRRDSVEPLPEKVRDEILATLHQALPTGALQTSVAEPNAPALRAGHANRPSAAHEELDMSTVSRLIDEFTAAWDTEPKPPAIAAKVAESHARTDHMAMRLALGQHEDDLAALQSEHSRVLGLLEARARSAAQLQEELRELSAQFEAARADLQLQQRKTREIQKSLAERDALIDQTRARVASLEAELALARQRSLRERDAAIEAQKLQHTKVMGAFMARAKTTESELKAARERIEAQQAELETRLPLTARSRAPAAHVELRRDIEIGEFSPPATLARVPTWQLNAGARTIGIAVAVVLLAVVAWAALHHAHAPTANEVTRVAAPLPATGTVLRDCPTCPLFTVLPAGRFKQGSADGTASASVRPMHWVSINHPFAMSTSAVTVDEFRAFATATGRDMQGCDTYDGRWRHQAKSSWQNPGFEQRGTHPVTCASFNDATAYAQWLSLKTGHHYRLPSASEWEYAARGGGDAVQPWNANGSDACASANVADASAARRFPGWTAFACNDGYVFTAPVGSFKANAFGLHDMLGNVFQWTADCWNANYQGAPVDGSARTDGNCNERELRGGSWFSSPGYVRADYRNHFAANYRASSAGIRLVRDLTP